MKRTKRVFALLMAAVFALSLVPVGAWAATPDNGEMYYDQRYDGKTGAGEGTITIANTQQGETYNLYRIFDLASFVDADTTPGEHAVGSEMYSYVIRENSPWYEFLTNNQLYPNSESNMAVVGQAGASSTAGKGQLFWIEPAAITLTDPYGHTYDKYHVVTATDSNKELNNYFPDAWDVDKTGDENKKTYEYDEVDYANSLKHGVTIVQDFAQRALRYAEEVANGSPRISPNYSELGIGNGEVESSSQVVVNNRDMMSADSSFLSGGIDHHAKQGGSGKGKVYLGWYLMGTTMGALASLDTTNKNVIVYDKVEKPELLKRVLRKRSQSADEGTRNTANYVYGKEDLVDLKADSDRWVESTDADLGDYIQFKTVITARQGASGYKIHDVMEDGLEFVDGPIAAATNAYDDSALKGANGVGENNYDYTLRIYHVPYDEEATLASATGTEVFKDPIEIPRKATKSSDGSTTVTVKNFEVITKTQDGNPLADGCDFEIACYDSVSTDQLVTYLDKDGEDHPISEKDKLVVLYWAKVGQAAALWKSEARDQAQSQITDNSGNVLDNNHQAPSKVKNGSGRNDNYTIITYGNASHTALNKASVTTYRIDIVKTGAEEASGVHNLLGGAKFSVYKANRYTNHTNDPAASNGKQYQTSTASGAITYEATSDRLAFEEMPEGGASKDAYYRYKGDSLSSEELVNSSTVLTSSADRAIRLCGLEAGTYLIFEEEAPEGYNKLAYPIVVTITGDNDNDGLIATDSEYNTTATNNALDSNEGLLTITTKGNSKTSANQPDAQVTKNWEAGLASDATYSGSNITTPATYNPGSGTNVNGGVHIVNQTGQELPSTGGIGTTIFYVVGGVLVAGAAVLLVTKRRMGTEA